MPERGVEAQIDWYEAYADVDGERVKLYVFSMRSMASGAAFHRAYPCATQQAFLEAHELAFAYFDGVFRVLRYDNLSSAVKKILGGQQRELTSRFIAFRSHWKCGAEFCTPSEGHEKGGVEGEVGYFRRNHWVPVPVAADLAELNRKLLADCRADESRTISGQTEQTPVLEPGSSSSVIEKRKLQSPFFGICTHVAHGLIRSECLFSPKSSTGNPSGSLAQQLQIAAAPTKQSNTSPSATDLLPFLHVQTVRLCCFIVRYIRFKEIIDADLGFPSCPAA
jgi:hypothetical protein